MDPLLEGEESQTGEGNIYSISGSRKKHFRDGCGGVRWRKQFLPLSLQGV